MTTRARCVLVLAAVAALALPACAGDDDDAAESATTDAPNTTEAPNTTTTVTTPVVAAGCTASTPAAPGEETITTTSSATERTYIRHVPPAYDPSTPMPLVVDLHGYAEGSVVHVQMSALGPFGDEHGFITITPQGTGQVARWDTEFDSADMTYLGDLLDEAEATLCVDTRRIFATGLSNGAFMTSAVACVYAARIAAVAPVAGIQDAEGCDPARAVPVIAFHGTADTFVSFDGGLGPAVANLPDPDGSGSTIGETADEDVPSGPSVPEVAGAWAARNGCDESPVDEQVADDVTVSAWDCPDGADVRLYRVIDGGHAWPGSEFSRNIESVVGRTTFSISANELMWEFFEQHPLS